MTSWEREADQRPSSMSLPTEPGGIILAISLICLALPPGRRGQCECAWIAQDSWDTIHISILILALGNLSSRKREQPKKPPVGDIQLS